MSVFDHHIEPSGKTGEKSTSQPKSTMGFEGLLVCGMEAVGNDMGWDAFCPKREELVEVEAWWVLKGSGMIHGLFNWYTAK